MMTLHYIGESVLLTDDVCDALLRYARALAETQGSDVVTVPVLTADGEPRSAEFLLGPASQLYATSAPDSAEEERHPAVVAELDRRIRLLHPRAVISPVEPTSLGDFEQDFG
jgi:hypothetical protein